MPNIGRRLILASAAAFALSATARAVGEAVLRIAYLRNAERQPTISPREQPSKDSGIAGAKLAVEDSAGNGPTISLLDLKSAPDDATADLVKAVDDSGADFVFTDLPGNRLAELADALKPRILLNLAAPDEELREAGCRTNLLHIAPSRTMLADAVAQYLAWKRWPRWLLVVGSHPEDEALAAAYRRAAKRFGAKIVGERISQDTGGAHQTDSGVVQMQQQMPLLTQGAPEHDVVIAADENEVFAGYLPYRTWDPRPIAGSAGLRPAVWDPNAQGWGGEQLQSRFQRSFHRDMLPRDMLAWTGVRLLAEAAAAVNSAETAKILAGLHAPGFGIGAYKGVSLSLRPWNNQLRQPILLTDGRTVVSVSPQPGFLHPVSELDTLGLDQPETACHLIKDSK